MLPLHGFITLLTPFFEHVYICIQDAAVQPTLVIVYFGGNDSMGPHSSGLGPHVPLPEFVENMRKVALHLKVLCRSNFIQSKLIG